MMMKKLFVFGLAILLSLQAFPQFLKFGVKAGAESASVLDYKLIGGGTSPITAAKDAAWGWHAGLFLRLKLGPVYLQPETVFASTSFDYHVDNNGTNDLLKQKFDRLSVPILLGFKLGPLRINAGPAANVSIGSPKSLISDPNFSKLYKSAVWGYQAGIGVDILKRLTIDARVAGSLGDALGNTANIGGQQFQLDYGQTSLLLSLGWMF
jgi:hypothetical protein